MKTHFRNLSCSKDLCFRCENLSSNERPTDSKHETIVRSNVIRNSYKFREYFPGCSEKGARSLGRSGFIIPSPCRGTFWRKTSYRLLNISFIRRYFCLKLISCSAFRKQVIGVTWNSHAKL